jgi:hypothetical protein
VKCGIRILNSVPDGGIAAQLDREAPKPDAESLLGMMGSPRASMLSPRVAPKSTSEFNQMAFSSPSSSSTGTGGDTGLHSSSSSPSLAKAKSSKSVAKLAGVISGKASKSDGGDGAGGSAKSSPTSILKRGSKGGTRVLSHVSQSSGGDTSSSTGASNANLPKLSESEEKALETLCAFATWGNARETANSLRDNAAILPLILNRHNAKGQCALHCAAANGHEQVVLLLLNCAGIDADVRESGEAGLGGGGGDTALHLAVRSEKGMIVALLLAFGAKTHVTNRANNLTARQEAKGAGLDAFAVFDKYGVANLMTSYPLVSELSVLSNRASNEEVKSQAFIKEQSLKMDKIPISCKTILLFGYPRVFRTISNLKSLTIRIYARDNDNRTTKKKNVFKDFRDEGVEEEASEHCKPYLFATYFTAGMIRMLLLLLLLLLLLFYCLFKVRYVFSLGFWKF